MGLPPVAYDREMDARRLRRKNAKALRIAIEQSERKAAEAAAEAARLAKLKRQQDREVRRLKGLVILSDSDSDDGDDDVDERGGGAATRGGACAGARPGRQWRDEQRQIATVVVAGVLALSRRSGTAVFSSLLLICCYSNTFFLAYRSRLS